MTISLQDQPNQSISLDSAGVGQLIEFVRTLVENEFNRRQSFRIPLWQSCGLTVEICKAETRRSVRPVNISLTGICVEANSEDFDLAEDEEVEVILTFEDETRSVDGMVIGFKETGLRIFFRGSMHGEQVTALPEVMQIVMELQRRWMFRRSKNAV